MSRAWAVVENGVIVNVIVADTQFPGTVPAPEGRNIGDPVRGPIPRREVAEKEHAPFR